MKNLTTYINEKLKINKDFKRGTLHIDDSDFDWNKLTLDDIDPEYADMKNPPKRISTNNGKYYQWFKWWAMLTQMPMKKSELFYRSGFSSSPNESVNSHSTQFAALSRDNIIIYNSKTRKLEAQPMSEWRVR